MAPILTDNQLPKRVSVLGAARSGIAAAQYLAKRGVEVFVSDTCDESTLDFILASNGLAHVSHEAEEHTERVLESELLVLSPGIRADIPVLLSARKKGIPVWSEMELAYQVSSAPFLAVTGSTGKSTTVCLLGAIIEAAGKQCVVAGNIGAPAIRSAPTIAEDGIVVVEVSSFQLETIEKFKPRAAAVLNLMKNHLDRYKSEKAYYDAKKAIASNMDKGDCLVLNANDERLLSWSLQVQDATKVVFFGREIGDVDCVWHDQEKMFLRTDGTVVRILDLANMKIKGSHNYDNACAAAALAQSVGIEKEAIAKGLCTFGGLEHRLEFVRELNGVSYYNDSKSTTAESVISAVSAFGDNVHVICGGRDKGCDFQAAREAVEKHVRSAVVIGEAAGRISKEWNGLTSITHADSLHQAVMKLHKDAREGEVVVLSPGCSSFDMFSSYEERGTVFKKLVNALDEQR